MKKIVFLLMQLYVLNFVIAQNYINNKYIFGNEYAGALLQSVLEQQDTIVIAGFIGEWVNVNQRKSFTAKLNLAGDVLQFKLLDTTSNNYFWVYPRTLSPTQTNGYLCAGIYDNPTDYMCCFMAKLSHNLDTIWTKKICHIDSNKQLLSIANIELPNGNIYLFCEVWVYGNTGVVDNNVMIILLDSQGNEIKRTEWGNPSIRQQPKGILSTTNGLFMYGGGGFASGTQIGGFILQVGDSADILDAYVTPTSDSMAWFSGLDVLADSNFITCGLMVRKNQTTGLEYCINYISKLKKTTFEKMWQIPFSAANCEYARVYKAVATPDGGAVICGDDEGNKGWLVKVNTDGQIIWDRRHTLIGGGDHYFSDMVSNSDGGFTIVGLIYSPNTDTIGTYAWLARTDSFGCLVPGCQSVGIAENTPIENSLKLYPNPTNDRLFLYYNNPQYKNFVFAITDLTGREVVPNTPLQSSTTYEIVVRDWAKGLYFVRVFDTEGQNVYTEKFVKE